MSVMEKALRAFERLVTNPVVGLVVLLCAMGIRELVVLVVFVDEVQQDRTALKQSDSLVAQLVRYSWDSSIWIDLQEPVFLFKRSVSALRTCHKLKEPLTFCVFLARSMAVVCSTCQHSVRYGRGPQRR